MTQTFGIQPECNDNAINIMTLTTNLMTLI